jgi:hypothetical protein
VCSQWQILWLLASCLSTAELARVTGCSVRRVQETVRRYRTGQAAIGTRRHGNRGAARFLNGEQLRLALAGPDPDGGIWTCRHVAAWIGAQIGSPIDTARRSTATPTPTA